MELPASIAPMVMGVAGLENYIHVHPKLRHSVLRHSAHKQLTGPFDVGPIRVGYDSLPMYSANPVMQGQGRTIAINSLEYTYPGDTLSYIGYEGLPIPASGAGSNVTLVNINGGAADDGSASGEANLDVQMVLGMAPLANVLIYNADNSDADYLSIVTQMASDNKADIITDSWGGSPDATGYMEFHAQHLIITAQGQSYLNASGDYGSDIQADGDYPEDDPEVLSVGGTVLTVNDSTYAYESETGWHGSAGGYVATAPFTLPSYQVGRGVPTTIDYRLIPDIALNASDPDDSGSYNFYFMGSLITGVGTSFRVSHAPQAACPWSSST